jgi:hypothetical protein
VFFLLLLYSHTLLHFILQSYFGRLYFFGVLLFSFFFTVRLVSTDVIADETASSVAPRNTIPTCSGVGRGHHASSAALLSLPSSAVY